MESADCFLSLEYCTQIDANQEHNCSAWFQIYWSWNIEKINKIFPENDTSALSCCIKNDFLIKNTLMKSLLIAIGTNKALICYRALILFYSVPFWQFSSKLGNLDWNNGINSSAVMLYKLPGICEVSSAVRHSRGQVLPALL